MSGFTATQPYLVTFETNAGTVTTSATGAGTVSATKLSQVAYAHVEVGGYVAMVTSTTGQSIVFQLYQQSAATGALTKPAAAVTIDPGDLSILELGN